MLILILDCEGLLEPRGGQKERDNFLFILSILLSSLFIYNSKAVATSSDLEHMDFVLKMSQIQLKADQEVGEEQMMALKEIFPDFYWVLRDCHLEMVDFENKPCTPTDYLLKNILRHEKIGRNRPTAERAQLLEKNDRKQTILESFRSINCFAVPSPSADKEILHNMSNAPAEQLEKEFMEKIEEVVESGLEKVKAKKYFSNNFHLLISPFCELAETLVTQLNQPGAILAVDSIMESASKKAMAEELKKQVEIYLTAMTEWQKSHCPAPLQALLDHHSELFREATNNLLKALSFADLRFSKEAVLELQKLLIDTEERSQGEIEDSDECEIKGGCVLQFVRKNQEASAKFCVAKVEELWRPIQEKITNCKNNGYNFQLFNQDSSRVVQELDRLIQHLPMASEAKRRLWEKIESQSKFIRELEGFNAKLAEEAQRRLQQEQLAQAAQQRLEEASASYNEKVRELQIQMEAREKQAREEVEVMKRQQDEQMKAEMERLQKLQDAKFEEQAEQQRQLVASLQQQHKDITIQLQQNLSQMTQTVTQLQKDIQAEKSRPRGGGGGGFFGKIVRFVSSWF